MVSIVEPEIIGLDEEIGKKLSIESSAPSLKKRQYSFPLFAEEEDDDAVSPTISRLGRSFSKASNSAERSVNMASFMEGNEEKVLTPEAELKQFVDNFSNAFERTTLLAQTKMSCIKKQYKDNNERFADASPAFPVLMNLADMVVACSYVATKACHQLQPKLYTKPLKPVCPTDVEEAFEAMSWSLSKININAPALSGLLRKCATTPVPKGQTAYLTDKGTIVTVEDGSPIPTAEAQSVRCVFEEKLDLEELRAMPCHLSEIVSEMNRLIRLSKPGSLTSMKGAANVILAAMRWKRRLSVPKNTATQ